MKKIQDLLVYNNIITIAIWSLKVRRRTATITFLNSYQQNNYFALTVPIRIVFGTLPTDPNVTIYSFSNYFCYCFISTLLSICMIFHHNIAIINHNLITKTLSLLWDTSDKIFVYVSFYRMSLSTFNQTINRKFSI